MPNKKGYFIEIGGADGIINSNTISLERQYGWNGVCIEADPYQYSLLKKNRSCTTVNSACSSASGEKLEFVLSSGTKNPSDYSRQMSGLLNFAKKHKKTLLDSKKQNPECSFVVTTKTLTEILNEIKAPENIDFLSLDVEGAELEVLYGIDFKKYKIDCILVEHNHEYPKRSDICKLLFSNNYYKAENLLIDDLYRLK